MQPVSWVSPAGPDGPYPAGFPSCNCLVSVVHLQAVSASLICIPSCPWSSQLELTHLFLCLPGSHPCPTQIFQATEHKTPLPQGVRSGTVMRIRGVVPEQAGR